MAGWLSAQANCSFGVLVASATANPGDTVVLDVRSQHFTGVTGFQYTHAWDPAALSFVEVITQPNVLGITFASFNTDPAVTALGHLNVAVLEPTTNGYNLPDNTVLYRLKFVYHGGAATVRTDGSSLPVEWVGSDYQVANHYYFIHGQVGAQPSTLGWTGACIMPPACSMGGAGSIAALATAGIAPTYQWTASNGYTGSGAFIEDLSEGTYHLLVTAGNAPSLSGDFYLIRRGELTVTAAVDADDCGGAPDGGISAAASGGSGSYTYAWSNGATTAAIGGLAVGNYTVTVTDAANGCIGVRTFTVPSDAPFNVWHQSVLPSCAANSDGAITVMTDATGGLGPLQYLWSTGATTPTVSGLTEGVYAVTVTTATGCSQALQIALVAQSLVWDAAIEQPACSSNGDGRIALALPAGDFSVLWSTGSTATVIDGLPAGDYTVTVTNNAGCSQTATYNLRAEGLVASYSYNCYLINGINTADISVLVWTPQDAPFTFQWSNGQTEVSSLLSNIVVVPGQAYSVTITGASGCTQVLENMVAVCGVPSEVRLSLTPDLAYAQTGDTWCTDVVVDGFTGINGFQFSMNWDRNNLQFASIGEWGVSGLDASDFNLLLTSDGRLSTSWLAQDVAVGETLAPGSVLFQVCWTVIGTEEVITSQGFSHSPTAIEFTHIAGQVIPTQTQGNQLVINGEDVPGEAVVLRWGDVVAVQGNAVCVPLYASNFRHVTAMQGTMEWDADALLFSGVHTLDLPNFNGSSIGNLATAQTEGYQRFVWSNSEIVNGISLADETPLFEVCFIANGAPGEYPIALDSLPMLIELVDNHYESMAFTTQPGSVTILAPSTDAAGLRISSAAAAPGATVCLPVEVTHFNELVGMQFSINWDANRLLYDTVLISNALPGLSSFNLNAPAGDNHLVCSWTPPNLLPVTLAPGTVLFEVCFTAQGLAGNAAVVFSHQPIEIEFIRGSTLILVPFAPTNGFVTISEQDPVWPGDTNADEIANHHDLLHIGLGYHAQGLIRANASTHWLPQHSAGWIERTPVSETNFRHIDTNGDGSINAADTLAIRRNWGRTVDNFTGGGAGAQFFTGAPFFVQPDTVAAGATVQLPIILGTADEPVAGAYGVAFTIHYDPIMVVPGSVVIDFTGWMGTLGEDLLALYRDYPGEGRVEVALVRTDGQTLSGQGAIAHLSIIMEDVILRGFSEIDVEVPIRIDGVNLINNQEVTLPTAPRQTVSLVLGVTGTEEPAALRPIGLEPNPTTGIVRLTATADADIQSLTLWNTQGQLVGQLPHTATTLDVTAYPAGLYYLQIQTPLGSVYRKLVRQ